MTDPTEDDVDRDRVMRIIMARCGDVLSEDEVAAAFGADAANASTEAMLPVEIGEQILAVVEALDEKVDALAEAVGVNKDDE